MGVSRKREREIVEQYVAMAAFTTLLLVGGVATGEGGRARRCSPPRGRARGAAPSRCHREPGVCGLACSNEAVAAGIRLTFDHLLLRNAPAQCFGDSDALAVVADNASTLPTASK
ncbi:hypothetical protein OsJ_29671 [Oryza sativa Japonica Group]|uniref:Uncharacterized protein n=1 Tax=Oryza sativa subsp. japonica TaxID=39947 RepID=B9G417_ORYSJ|nr:hypothetical protein OsJ_29671 [Oryza sativa Japonica Group]